MSTEILKNKKMKMFAYLPKLVHLPGYIIKNFPAFMKAALESASFFILLMLYIFGRLFHLLAYIPVLKFFVVRLRMLYIKTIGKELDKLVNKLDKSSSIHVKRSYLITLAYKNLMSKKNRTLITILGMSIGVGIIVLLLSFGYGVERLIISRIASLDDLKIVDVTAGANTTLRLENNSLNKIKKIQGVAEVLPLVSFVGKISFNNAKTDVLVYAADNVYLESINTELVKGTLFTQKSSQATNILNVKGAATKRELGLFGNPVDGKTIKFTIPPETKAYARSACSMDGKILGRLTALEGGFYGKEYFGRFYKNDEEIQYEDKKTGDSLSVWVRANVPLFYEVTNGNLVPKIGDNGRQVWDNVCIKKTEIQKLETLTLAGVLGDATASAQLSTDPANSNSASESAAPLDASPSASLLGEYKISTDSAGVEVITLISEADKKNEQVSINMQKGKTREAIVSTALLQLLNIPINKAINTPFTVAFILSKNLIPTLDGKVSSAETQYIITGVIEDLERPYFYIPLNDAQELKIENFSQLRVLLSEKDALSNTRKQIEVLGYRTNSTADTVNQIESLFANLRVILALLGLVALGVASLGMFNTLTISLLERTREIGGMKTIGMVSKEVRDLFLAEAMMLGLSGGFGGLFIGWAVGKLISFLVSILAFTKGEGYLELTYIPGYLIIFIIVSSFIVGILTGLYPAYRARKISALNALRYE